MNSPTELPRKLLLILAVLGGSFVCNNLRAGRATWSENPMSGDWYTAANWNPHTVPNGPNDIATLGASSITDLTFPASSTTVLDSLILQVIYDVAVGDQSSLTFVGAGALKEFEYDSLFLLAAEGGTITFQGNSTAQMEIDDRGIVSFQDTSTETGGVSVYGGGVLTFPAKPPPAYF